MTDDEIREIAAREAVKWPPLHDYRDARYVERLITEAIRILSESGYAVVPVEPTPEMIKAAHKAKIFLNMTDTGWRDAYTAMIRALSTATRNPEKE